MATRSESRKRRYNAIINKMADLRGRLYSLEAQAIELLHTESRSKGYAEVGKGGVDWNLIRLENDGEYWWPLPDWDRGLTKLEDEVLAFRRQRDPQPAETDDA
jgi:hypothetical protein